ncbi:GntR family transcriptional regulator [Pseudonocardia ailaonensis]|uniref:GntR family transcriptional regulator n=1 Tax=Pseudonocardia ailaonensis TaxID=367279 RepID=UPI0031D4BF45
MTTRDGATYVSSRRKRQLAQPRTFADQAAEMIREIIVSGEIKGGDRLNEVALSQMLGISRSPIREALNLLASEKLVVLNPGKGAFVPTITPMMLHELGEARLSLECAAAALAAVRATDADIEAMERVLADAERTLRADDSRWPAEFDLHDLILRASGNSVIEELASSVNTRMRLARLASGHNRTRAREAYEEHVAIVDALRARDPRAAEKAVHAHLELAVVSARDALTRKDTTADRPTRRRP